MIETSPDASRIDSWKGQRVTVVGLGKSGVAAARLLQALGAKVRVADYQPESKLTSQLSQLDRHNLDVFVGTMFEQAFQDVERIVLSPGVPGDLSVLESVRNRGGQIIGELELASRFLHQDLVAVTGTKGKSTTVSLLGRIFEESGRRAFIGGNLGVPLCEAALAVWQQARSRTEDPVYEVIVAETSSFQLETIEGFHPRVAVWLNFTPDHLDRYRSMAEYRLAKTRLFKNHMTTDCAVMNLDDPVVTAVGKSLPSVPYWFSLTQCVDQGAFLDRGHVIAQLGSTRFDFGPKHDIGLRGDHNIANVLAAVIVGLLCGCPEDAIRRAIREFHGVPHALELVRERRGVLYVNDSKGTNVDATLKALSSFETPLLVILGGKDKGGNFELLREPLSRQAKRIYLIGEAAPKIQQALEGVERVTRVESLQAAVELAAKAGEKGDVVLLSPACASFDMFRDYQDRGQQFREAVNALA